MLLTILVSCNLLHKVKLFIHKIKKEIQWIYVYIYFVGLSADMQDIRSDIEGNLMFIKEIYILITNKVSFESFYISLYTINISVIW